MTAISLMPPVAYCPSCEGQKAEDRALQIAASRADKAEAHAVDGSVALAGHEGVHAAAGAEAARPQALDGRRQLLLAPDLAVQVSLVKAGEEVRGERESLLLRSAQVYQTS